MPLTEKFAFLPLAVAIALASAVPLNCEETAKPSGQFIEDADFPVERPNPDKIIAELSIPLKLDSAGEERLRAALTEVVKKYEKLEMEYSFAKYEAKRLRVKFNDLRYKMKRIKINLPDAIRPVLNPEQQETFDKLLEGGYLSDAPPQPLPQPAVSSISSDNSQYTETRTIVPIPGQPGKRKIIIRRVRKKTSPKAAPAITQDKAGTPAPEAGTEPAAGGSGNAVKAPAEEEKQESPAPKKKTQPPARQESTPEEEAPSGAYP